MGFEEHAAEHIDLINWDDTLSRNGGAAMTKLNFFLKDDVSPGDDWKVLKKLNAVLAYTEITVNGKVPRAGLPVSAEFKPKQVAAGKLFGWLRSKGVRYEHSRPQWGNPMLAIDVREEQQGGRAVKVAQWEPLSGWSVSWRQ